MVGTEATKSLEEERKKGEKKKIWLILGVVFLVLAIVEAVLGGVLGTKKSGEKGRKTVLGLVEPTETSSSLSASPT